MAPTTTASALAEARALMLRVLEELDIKYQPRRDRVLVQPIEEHGDASDYVQRVSGLYVSSAGSHTEGEPIRGIVISTGPGTYNRAGNLIPTDVRPGDIVIFTRYAGDVVSVKGSSLRLVKAADLLAIVEND